MIVYVGSAVLGVGPHFSPVIGMGTTDIHDCCLVAVGRDLTSANKVQMKVLCQNYSLEVVYFTSDCTANFNQKTEETDTKKISINNFGKVMQLLYT